MRIRVKFSKTGAMKFIGHLDVMRYFQKALRRAQIPFALSGGFSPHMLMSFAAPLGVGKTSSGEYFDLDLKSVMDTGEICRRLNEQMAEGFSVLSVCEIPEDKSSKGMAQVAAAAYSVTFPIRQGSGETESGETCTVLTDDAYDGSPLRSPARAGYTDECIHAFLLQPQIHVMRKTKRKEELTDIRPWILSVSADERAIHMMLSAGSVQNLKPELVMESLTVFAGGDPPSLTVRIHRDELFALSDQNGTPVYVSLDAMGE